MYIHKHLNVYTHTYIIHLSSIVIDKQALSRVNHGFGGIYIYTSTVFCVLDGPSISIAEVVNIDEMATD